MKMKFNEGIEHLHEGLWDRTKARASGAVGAVKGLGNQIAGGVKGAVAGVTGNSAAAQAAAQQGKQGAISGQLAKINSYKATAQKKIQNLSNEIFNDLSKLGIDIKSNPNVANGFIGELNKGFDTLVGGIQGNTSTPPTAAPVTKPPVLRSRTPSTTPASPSTPTASSTAPASPSPATSPAPASPDEKAILDDLTKNKNEILGDNGLIGKAKFVAGQKGIGDTGKAGVELLKRGSSGDEGVEASKEELAKKYNIPPEKLVELLGKVFTESKKNKKSVSYFTELYKKI